MKNKLGIEVKCENCIVKNSTILRQRFDCEYCRKKKYVFFNPCDEAYENRIKELQKVMSEEADAIDLGVAALNKHYEEQIQRLKEQQFTWDELNIIRNIIIEVKRVRDPRYYGFHPTSLLNKIERILNNEQ